MEVLKCQICKIKFDFGEHLPHSLSACTHIACSRCIENELSSKKKYQCPLDSTINDNISSPFDFPIHSKIIKSIRESSSDGCTEHDRKFEFFCLEDESEICPLCGLFGNHKGHTIIIHKDLKEMTKKMFEDIEIEKTKISVSEELKRGEDFQTVFKTKLAESLKTCKKQIDQLYQVGSLENKKRS